jgi:hypothetical protein
MKKIYDISKEYLEEHYVKQQKSADDICKELNIKSKTIIFRLLKKYNIKPNSREGKPCKKTKKFGEIHQSYLYLLKERANRKNLKFNLNGKYLWRLFLKQNRKCALSGIEIVFPKAWGARSKTQITASLDRVDSNKGYIVGNVQWVHKQINTMKMNMSDDEFINLCRMVTKNYDSDLL